VKYGHNSSAALLKAFYDVKNNRGASRGAATDEEQDILRAMIVTAGACIDSTLKQLFRDALHELAQYDDDVKSAMQKFISRELRNLEGSPKLYEHLAASFMVDYPFDFWVDRYVYELTGSSLQSTDQLFMACAAFGIKPNNVGVKPDDLKPIFVMRNRIIHEMDINFDEARRNRRQRAVGTSANAANKLLEVTESILLKVDTKLCGHLANR
jgi:hypothetical protein